MIIYDMNVLILKHGMGSKAIAMAKECNISGGTVLLGKGTIRNSFLSFFELAESTKEIVLVIANRELGCKFLERANSEFGFIHQNHGIAFSIELSKVMGYTSYKKDTLNYCQTGGEVMFNYDSIFVIVDKGKGEDVVDAASEAGARGATIVNARGSGVHETSKIFAIEIEPEKEIVLILTKDDITQAVCDNINKKMKLDESGNGILFVQKVNKAYGIY
ncbi:P-II family nitrogen regulator [Acetoanaerobium noterae]|jgi:nitrogen regulatory protein PII|uniref:P-II family nitrogen regulator n=1 Tax=Acetoanaerobium noterae TaxID=745369 RepID=UPI0033413201